MAWDINQLNVDFKQNRATVTLIQQAPPATPNGYMNVNVSFGVDDADQRKEGETEVAIRARAKQVLLDAAASL